MIIVIFFGGIVLGFLMGFIAMALLAAANHQNRAEKITAALAYHQIMTGMPPQEISYLGRS
jgi:hypothetical protein